MGRMGSVLGNVSVMGDKAGEVSVKASNAMLKGFDFILQLTKK